MLSSEQAIIRFERGQAIPDRLTRQRHAHYLSYAQRMLDVYRHGVGLTRADLHRSIRRILQDEPDCPPQRVSAFCKLLDDASEYDEDSSGGASELRLRVFQLAAKYHPLVTAAEGIFEHTETEVKGRIAEELGMPWGQIESALYADLIEFQPLEHFEGYPTPGDLLARYNVAQVQVCLYRATRVRLLLTGDFKRIIRYVRLLRLLHDIRRCNDGYEVTLSGPVSVLHETRRYGVDLAKLVPVLVACEGWYLQAAIQTPWKTQCTLKLSHEDGLRSHLPPTASFDSSVEEAFASKWGEEAREGWRLHREAVILQEHQSVFFPDFVFRHEDGREAYLEVVGYWTPEYLEKKRETLRRFRNQRILLAVCEKSLREGAEIPQDVVVYKTAIKVEPVMEMLRKLPVS